MRYKNNKFQKPAMALCILIYCVVTALIPAINKMDNFSIHMFGGIIHSGEFSGVLITVQLLSCIFLTMLNSSAGSLISFILLIYSIISMFITAITKQNPRVMPGIATMLLGIIVIYILKKQLIQRERDAETDFLTGLSNRRGLIKYMKSKIDSKKAFSILYIDIDDFKFINDTLGHKTGDMVLCEITQRITDIIGDKGSLSRIGGDEFIVILDGSEVAGEKAMKCLESISREIKVTSENTHNYVTASIGISNFPNDSTDADTLIKYADIAMYQAKECGKNKYRNFDASLEKQILRQSELENIIKESIDKDAFSLVFQPQYENSGEKLRGFETLLRLTTEDGTVISPSELIPAAEKTDLILSIDYYVLKKAMNMFSNKLKNVKDKFTVSINVSAKNISTSNFADNVNKIIDETGFPADCLEIEITEYCIVQSFDTAVENINKLRQRGVQFAIDDFGTGYASLSYISKIPLDLLKIDKSFIDDIEKDSVSCDFVNAVISMGHLLGYKVISEGVENEKQLDILSNQNCDYIQGFVLGKPLSYDDALKLFEE